MNRSLINSRLAVIIPACYEEARLPRVVDEFCKRSVRYCEISETICCPKGLFETAENDDDRDYVRCNA
jgi:hypothetical protein